MSALDKMITEMVRRMTEAQATADEIGIAKAMLAGEPYYDSESVVRGGSGTRHILPSQRRINELQARLIDVQQITAAVLDVHKDQNGSTHYADCWKYHVACLAYEVNETVKEVAA